MRWRDLIGLALFALSRHKVRTALTTLGVLFGTLVLVVSLSIRQGVQETIVHQVSKHAELRRIEVRPKHKPASEPEPVVGTMSEERRQRLNQERRDRHGSGPRPVLPLTPALLEQMAELDHVVRVEPVIYQHGRVLLNDRGRFAMLVGLPREAQEQLSDRVVAGAMLSPGDDGGALLSEYLLYELGVGDEEAMHRVIGRSFTFEVRLGEQPPSLMLLRLLTGGGVGAVRLREEDVLAKVLQRLPDSLDRLGLTPPEQEVMRRMLRQSSKSAKKAEVYRATFHVKGVVRAGSRRGVQRRSDWMLHHVDLLVSPAAARAFFLRMPQVKEGGFQDVIVEVDNPDNVKSVQERLQELGVNTQSAIDYIEREQFVYTIVFTAMTVVALTALLVAAIGITNTMLMSVLERVREIGICKAVGARDRHILTAFLVEGALIGAVGGVLGLLGGWGVSFPADVWLQAQVSRQMNLELDRSLFSYPAWLVLGAPLFAVAVTTVAALYPARRAVRIDPVQALRHE